MIRRPNNTPALLTPPTTSDIIQTSSENNQNKLPIPTISN
jgi:hypothetical protein